MLFLKSFINLFHKHNFTNSNLLIYLSNDNLLIYLSSDNLLIDLLSDNLLIYLLISLSNNNYQMFIKFIITNYYSLSLYLDMTLNI